MLTNPQLLRLTLRVSAELRSVLNRTTEGRTTDGRKIDGRKIAERRGSLLRIEECVGVWSAEASHSSRRCGSSNQLCEKTGSGVRNRMGAVKNACLNLWGMYGKRAEDKRLDAASRKV